MYDGPVVDTHHHLWEVRHYPWLTAPPAPKIFGEDYEQLRHDYLIDDWRADIAGSNVVASVHVQAHYDPPNHVGETRWLQRIADEHGYPHAIVGHADMAADDIEAVLDGHMAFANFRGIRDVVTHNPAKQAWQAVDRPDWCLSPSFRAASMRCRHAICISNCRVLPTSSAISPNCSPTIRICAYASSMPAC
jgi:predicted TIM-barrel fold metal-dependent hydrolase